MNCELIMITTFTTPPPSPPSSLPIKENKYSFLERLFYALSKRKMMYGLCKSVYELHRSYIYHLIVFSKFIQLCSSPLPQPNFRTLPLYLKAPLCPLTLNPLSQPSCQEITVSLSRPFLDISHKQNNTVFWRERYIYIYVYIFFLT